MPEIRNDQTGSIIPREPAEWLVCFVPAIERMWWHPLLSWMKHCFALQYDPSRGWLLFEPWWSRVMITHLGDSEAERFLEWASRGITLRVKEHIPGKSSQLRGWMSCAAMIAHLLGRDYLVWTPKQLYDRLLWEPSTRTVDLHDPADPGIAKTALALRGSTRSWANQWDNHGL